MDLKSQIRAELEKAHAIATAAAAANRGLTDDETNQIQAHQTKVAELKQALAAQALAEQISRDISDYQGAPSHQGGPAPAPTVPALPRAEHPNDPPREDSPLRVEVIAPQYERGDAIGALIAARVRFGQDHQSALAWARRTYGERSRQMAAMQQSSFTAGGAFIAENFVGQELIELLRATAAVRRAGARELPLVNGSATIPKVTGGATAYWGNEGADITPSELQTGDVKLVEKKLTCLVPVSNDLLKNSNIAVDRLIRDDMVRAAANEEDIAFLKGDGLINKPKGIYYWVGAAGRTNSAGTTLANVRTDIRTALNRLGNNNAPMVRRAWFMHSRTKNYIAWDLVDGNSNFAFPELRNGQTLADAPVFLDNNISIVLGGGANASENYYVEMTECFIGDDPTLEIEVIRNAAYVDAAGTVRSGVSRDESVIRLIRKTDFAMRHTVSAHVLEAVTYGA